VHPRYEVDRALSLEAEGLSDCEVSRRTGISRTTIAEWRRDGPPGRRDATSRSSWPRCEGRRLDAAAYAFLLGMYLGDGSIARHPRAYKLRVVQDARYPNSIEEIRRAMATVRHCELDRIRTVHHVGCVEVYTYWKHWPCVFPQHGPGAKHHRRIELAAWQASIVAEHPTSFLRGLIHSDGCRVINRIEKGKYTYPRYLFSNLSEDIRRIFREACDSVGVHPTNPKPDEISIARRMDVVALDSFVGPKT
jgi:hypothetical protein